MKPFTVLSLVMVEEVCQIERLPQVDNLASRFHQLGPLLVAPRSVRFEHLGVERLWAFTSILIFGFRNFRLTAGGGIFWSRTSRHRTNFLGHCLCCIPSD